MAATSPPSLSANTTLYIRRIRTINLFIGLAVCITLSACAGLPQPFKGQDVNDRILTSIIVNPGVAISPIAGLPTPLNEQLAAEVAAATRDKDVVASVHSHTTQPPGKGLSRLDSIARIIPDTNTDTAQRLEIIWTLTSADGLGTDTITTQTPLPMGPNDQSVSDANYAPAINDVSSFLQGALFRPSALKQPETTQTAKSEPTADTQPYQLVIGKIEGAPGNGDRLMAEAMRLIFSAENLSAPVDVIKTPSPQAFIIEGTSKLSSATDRAETIAITWTVKDIDGGILGQVKQSNQVPRGSLDGDWGDTAFYAAEAAAEGILNILLQFTPN